MASSDSNCLAHRRGVSVIPAATSIYWLRFAPAFTSARDFFDLHKEAEDLLGCEVDLLTRRPEELDENSIRRRSILASTRDIYTA